MIEIILYIATILLPTAGGIYIARIFLAENEKKWDPLRRLLFGVLLILIGVGCLYVLIQELSIGTIYINSM